MWFPFVGKVDRARRRLATKRGGNLERTELDWLEAPMTKGDSMVLRVHETLDELAAEDGGKAEIVKLKFFAGMTRQTPMIRTVGPEPTSHGGW